MTLIRREGSAGLSTQYRPQQRRRHRRSNRYIVQEVGNNLAAQFESSKSSGRCQPSCPGGPFTRAVEESANGFNFRRYYHKKSLGLGPGCSNREISSQKMVESVQAFHSEESIQSFDEANRVTTTAHPHGMESDNSRDSTRPDNRLHDWNYDVHENGLISGAIVAHPHAHGMASHNRVMNIESIFPDNRLHDWNYDINENGLISGAIVAHPHVHGLASHSRVMNIESTFPDNRLHDWNYDIHENKQISAPRVVHLYGVESNDRFTDTLPTCSDNRLHDWDYDIHKDGTSSSMKAAEQSVMENRSHSVIMSINQRPVTEDDQNNFINEIKRLNRRLLDLELAYSYISRKNQDLEEKIRSMSSSTWTSCEGSR